MANYYVLLTDYGKSFIANAQANSQLALTHVVLGDANDQPYLPESRLNQTSLVKQRAKQPIASVKIINDTTAEVTAVIPSNVGGFNVHEIGVTDSSGKLVYVGNFHGGYRPTLTEGAGGDMELIITITADNLATVVIEAESQTVVATREWVTERFVTKPEFQEHLDAIDPHSQYLNQQRFSQFLQLAYPYGHKYWTHNKSNPKPLFDAMFGFETHWRRLEGVGLVAVKDGDAFIGQSMLTLGQRGTTELATTARPHTYPVYTSYLFERYNPDDVVETVWNVTANKTAITEGEAVRFTVTANNLPDGQILDWSVKEGELNADSNNIDAPEKSESGTVILKNGQAVIDFVTTPDDNTEEPQNHVRLTVGAPANLSINVPITDTGHHETVLHISQSTTDGISLDDYYYTQYGAYPAATDTVRFIVDDGVDIIAPNTATPAITEGANWPTGNAPIIENHGRILGRGGAGGRSARVQNDYDTSGQSISSDSVIILDAESGQDGGTAVSGYIQIDNHGLIAGGGGGGGGLGAYDNGFDEADSPRSLPIGGGGTGGGAPLGRSSPNEATFKAYKLLENYQNKIVTIPNIAADAFRLVVRPINGGKTTLTGADGAHLYTYPDQYAASNTDNAKLFHFAFGSEAKANAENLDFTSLPDGSYQYSNSSNYRDYYSSGSTPQLIRRMSTDASIEDIGLGGAQFNLTVNGSGALSTLFADSASGGAGGSIGEDGDAGMFYSYIVKDQVVTASEVRWEKPSAVGGLAGYISQGNVTINNYGSGTTKGR